MKRIDNITAQNYMSTTKQRELEKTMQLASAGGLLTEDLGAEEADLSTGLLSGSLGEETAIGSTYTGTSLLESTQDNIISDDVMQNFYDQLSLVVPDLYDSTSNTTTTTTPDDGYIYDPSNFNFSINPPTGNKLYKKPKGDGKHNKIAVIDCFDTTNPDAYISVDNTGTPAVTHGEFVASLIESQLKGSLIHYSVERMDTDISDSTLASGVANLRSVLKNIGDYRGVNISLCEYCDYDTVSAAIGEKVTPSNLASKRQKIMEAVIGDETTELYEKYKDQMEDGTLPATANLDESGELSEAEKSRQEALLILRYQFETTGEFYAVADEIARQGIPVFMAAGNDSQKFNFGSLLTNYVEYVTAAQDNFVDPYDPEFTGDFSKNSLTSRIGRESYYGNQVIDGKIDIDCNGSGDIDCYNIDTSTFFATGTSFSSPWALVRAIAKGDLFTGSQPFLSHTTVPEQRQDYCGATDDYLKYLSYTALYNFSQQLDIR